MDTIAIYKLLESRKPNFEFLADRPANLYLDIPKCGKVRIEVGQNIEVAPNEDNTVFYVCAHDPFKVNGVEYAFSRYIKRSRYNGDLCIQAAYSSRRGFDGKPVTDKAFALFYSICEAVKNHFLNNPDYWQPAIAHSNIWYCTTEMKRAEEKIKEKELEVASLKSRIWSLNRKLENEVLVKELTT
jgi:hypothetical protein